MVKASPSAAPPGDPSRLRSLFHELDTNGDGRLDPTELSEGLRRMGYNHVTKEHIQQFLSKSDTDRTGDLDMSEFVDYLRRHEQQLHIVFEEIDENNDGKLCTEEIIRAFKRMGVNITTEDAAKLQARINPEDNSLDVSYEEWRNYLLFHPSTDISDIMDSWRINTRSFFWEDSDFHDIHEIVTPNTVFGEDIGVPEDFTEQDFIRGTWWRHLVAGGVAGAVSRTATAPLDRLKIFLQVHGGRKSLKIIDTMKYMLQEGGVIGLWRGNGINVIKIAPESAMKFCAYDIFKGLARGGEDRELQVHERFMAGSLAGGVSQTFVYPMEVLKTRLALRKTNEYTGVVDCAKKLYQAEGVRVFYRGYVPNLFGILPYAGIDLTVYETLRRRYLQEYAEEGQTPPTMFVLASGTLSSCCGMMAAYPLALVRTKLQSQAGQNLNLPEEQTRAIGLFRYILRTEGVKGLYRGIVPNFCKVAPAVSLSYYVYERVREHLGVEMN